MILYAQLNGDILLQYLCYICLLTCALQDNRSDEPVFKIIIGLKLGRNKKLSL